MSLDGNNLNTGELALATNSIDPQHNTMSKMRGRHGSITKNSNHEKNSLDLNINDKKKSGKVMKISKLNTEDDKGLDIGGFEFDHSSDDSIIMLDDEKSEYKKSQTFRQDQNLGDIPVEFKQKINDIRNIIINNTGISSDDVNAVLSRKTDSKKPSQHPNTMTAVLYLLYYITTFVLGGFVTLIIYIIGSVGFYTDGFALFDTSEPVKRYRRALKVPASANIIYEELVEGIEIDKYNIMQKLSPHTVHEESEKHLKYSKLVFELPETYSYKEFCASRVCHVKQYNGIDEDGYCYILTKKVASKSEPYNPYVPMKEYEESIAIVPISETESRVIFESTFDFGGMIPNILKHKISHERLKYLECIKSYFYDKNQNRVYETFRKATEIVKVIELNSRKDILADYNQDQIIIEEKNEEVKLAEKVSLEDIKLPYSPREESADACDDVDEISEDGISISSNLKELNTPLRKDNPFVADKVKRNTLSARPSHLTNQTQKKNRSSHNYTKENEVEVVFEEILDDQ